MTNSFQGFPQATAEPQKRPSLWYKMVSDGDHAAVVALASAVLLVVLVLGRVTTSMLWNLKEQKQMIDAGFERRLVPTAWRETWVKPQEAEAAK